MHDTRASFDAAMRRFSEDTAFRADCVSDGRAFLRAANAEPSDRVTVETHINDAKTHHFVIPTRPPTVGRELNESEMSVSGGSDSLSNDALAEEIADYFSSWWISMRDLNRRIIAALDD